MRLLSNTTPITLDEFEQLPDADGIQELLDGCVIEVPPPKLKHSVFVKNVYGILLNRFDQSRVWMETGFLMGRNCLQPDVAIIFPDQKTERDWFFGAPMLAVEVASRGNTPDELERKKNLYLSNGAVEVWIVYEKTRSVTVHSPGGKAISHSEAFRSAILKDEIALTAVFRGRA